MYTYSIVEKLRPLNSLAILFSELVTKNADSMTSISIATYDDTTMTKEILLFESSSENLVLLVEYKSSWYIMPSQ